MLELQQCFKFKSKKEEVTVSPALEDAGKASGHRLRASHCGMMSTSGHYVYAMCCYSKIPDTANL